MPGMAAAPPSRPTNTGMVHRSRDWNSRWRFRRVFLAVVAVGLFVMAVRPAIDPDLGWHLRTGQWIVQHGAVPFTDPFSFTRLGAPWVAHEWLAELAMFKLHGFGSAAYPLAGLTLVFALVISVAFCLCARTILVRFPGQHYVAGAFAVLAAVVAIPSYGVRPQMLTLLLASLTLLWLERTCTLPRERWPSLLWVPLGMALWANLHGGFAVGLALIGLHLAGVLLDALWRERSWNEVGPLARRLAWALVLGTAAVAVNPNGLRLYLYPLQTLGSASNSLISEWASPDFHRLVYWPFAAMLLLTLGLLATGPRRAAPSELLRLTVFTAAALQSARHVPLFALVAAPILAGQAIALLQANLLRWPAVRSLLGAAPDAAGWTPGGEGATTSSNLRGMLLPLALLLAAISLGSVQTLGVLQLQPQVEARVYPAGAAAWLRNHEAGEHLFNDYGWGGYLLWQLPARYRVYIDGRADLYGDAFLQDYADLTATARDASTRLQAAGVQTVIIHPQGALSEALRRDDATWQPVYLDGQAAIFVARGTFHGQSAETNRPDSSSPLPSRR